MSSASFSGDALYAWYEETEEPLWMNVAREHVLSWWLRDSGATHEASHWFTHAYPFLAPYYPQANPAQSSTFVDPAGKYTGYWWQ